MIKRMDGGALLLKGFPRTPIQKPLTHFKVSANKVLTLTKVGNYDTLKSRGYILCFLSFTLACGSAEIAYDDLTRRLRGTLPGGGGWIAKQDG